MRRRGRADSRTFASTVALTGSPPPAAGRRDVIHRENGGGGPSTDSAFAAPSAAREAQPADMRVPDELLTRAEDRRGLLTTEELRAAGVTRAALRWQLGRAWRLVLPGVVALFTGELDGRQRLVAGQLWAGNDAQVASLTAARWHGFEVRDDGVVRLLVGVNGSTRREGFAVRRRTTRL